jgi:putative hydrolase of the HAD superfamily
MSEYVELIRRHARPMEPIATDVLPVLRPLEGIRAVLLDIYGTMIISGSGDVGTVAAAPADAFSAACAAAGLRLIASGDEGTTVFVNTIQAAHADVHDRGIAHPEVNIVEIWRRTLCELLARDLVVGDVDQVDLQRLAIEYEVRVNPTWPMPGLEMCLEQLRAKNLQLGIISNAQFFTPMLFPALLQQSLADAGFTSSLCMFSYLYGQAKPGTFLFDKARESLGIQAIAPGEVLYVGNDMLNDVLPAGQVGFKTALFAGDQRSLRSRAGDPRVANLRPDLTITKLHQLPAALNFKN